MGVGGELVGGVAEVAAPGGGDRDEDVPLSSLIDVINKCFGSELTEADQLFFDQLAEAAVLDENLR